MDDRPLYNSKIIDLYLKFFRKKYPDLDQQDLLHHASMEIYEVNDPGHWFTQNHVDRFYERAIQLTGNPLIARQAGQFFASDEALGFVKTYILGALGPGPAFALIKKVTASLTRSSLYDSRRIAPHKIEVTVTPVEGVQEKLFQCENRLGFMDAALAMFHCDLPKIEHPECMFKGGKVCRYVISWKPAFSSHLKMMRTLLAAVLIVLCATLAWVIPSLPFPIPVSVSAFVVLLFSYFIERSEKREVHRALLSLRESTDELLEQAGEKYNNALLVNEVGLAISAQNELNEILSHMIQVLEKRLNYDRCFILLLNEKKTALEYRVGYGVSDELLSELKSTELTVTGNKTKDFILNSYQEQKPLLIAHPAESSVQTFICCPIVCEGESLGVLAVDNFRSRKPLIKTDLSLLTGIASVIGISLRNALYIQRDHQMQEQFRQSQKMEAVGQLAGGVAHDFNNMLSVIIGCGSLLLMKMDESNPLRHDVEQILSSADRAAKLTQRLLAFSRKHRTVVTSMDLNATLTGLEKLLKRLLTEDIELSTELSTEALPILADPNQIEQVILNLVTNARDAMPFGGKLRIRTGSVELDEAFVQSHGCGRPGPYATFAVQDTGIGMSQATREKIYEPFFTTKEVGKGTGLGLFMVYGIIKQFGGTIECASELGKGTEFTLYFPKAQKPAQKKKAETTAPILSGKETILLVEDEPEVRQYETTVLEQFGYTVIQAGDGEEAIQKFRDHRSAVRLLILDVVMPKKNGLDALAEIRELSPSLQAIFVSGYQGDAISAQDLQSTGCEILYKPFSPHEFLAKIRQILDSSLPQKHS